MSNEIDKNLDNEKIKKIFLQILKIEKDYVKTRTVTNEKMANEISSIIQKIVEE